MKFRFAVLIVLAGCAAEVPDDAPGLIEIGQSIPFEGSREWDVLPDDTAVLTPPGRAVDLPPGTHARLAALITARGAAAKAASDRARNSDGPMSTDPVTFRFRAGDLAVEDWFATPEVSALYGDLVALLPPIPLPVLD